MSNCIHTLIKEIAEKGDFVVLETVRSIKDNSFTLTIDSEQAKSFNTLTAVASSIPLSDYSGEWVYDANGSVQDVKSGKPLANLRKVQKNWVSVSQLLKELDIELITNIDGRYDFDDLNKQVLYKARARTKSQTFWNALKTSSIYTKKENIELHCVAA